jgi:hypothetical protein
MKERKTAKEMQDDIFRNMSAEKKLKLVSNFYRFGRQLNQLGKSYGAGAATERNRKDTQSS